MSTPGENSVPENENRAESVPGGQDDTRPDFTLLPQNSSSNLGQNNSSWSQTVRETMDTLIAVTRSFLMEITSIPGLIIRRYQIQGSLHEPLITTETTPAEGQLPTSHSQQIPSNESIPTQRNCSYRQALIKGTCLLCDIGFLTTPYAVKEGGWLSLTLLILFFLIAYIAGIYLMRCLESSAPRLETYPEIGQAAFGASGRMVIYAILYLGLYATCVEYAMMMRDNMKMILPITIDIHPMFGIIGTLNILPAVCLRDNFLSYLSAGASIVVILCLVWVGKFDQGFNQGGSGTALRFSNLPIPIGIYTFCFANHSAFPHLYTSMVEPARFRLVLEVGFMLYGFLCIAAAIFGFLIFGSEVESQFTLNMTTTFLPAKIAVWAVVLITISKYALTLVPLATSLEELVNQRGLGFYGVVAFVIRTALVISTLVVAMRFPSFASVMAFAGSMFGTILAVVVPCVCYFSIFHHRLNKFDRAACVVTGIAGLVIAFVGIYSSTITTSAKGPPPSSPPASSPYVIKL